MKLIGLELRVGGGQGYTLVEAKLFPVEIVFPPGGHGSAEAEVTFHTTNGDVTIRANLENDQPSRDAPYVDGHSARQLLRRQIEAGV